MHKITKGLKKKKKNKKHKKGEEELFDPEELEKYRREKQEAAERGETEGKDEEWQQFKALTAGVDSVLKQTQSDLDRIKSTSFFQRKPPGSSSKATTEAQPPAEKVKSDTPVKTKKWIGFGEGSGGIDDKPPEEDEEPSHPEEGAAALSTQETANTEQEFIEPEEEEEEEDEIEDQDDIFDTSYVDVVASGEIKLAYIPDSPVEENTDFDPFDTSVAEKVLPPEEIVVGGKKIKVVNLGCAVEVLTGILDKPIGVEKKARPRRKQEVDLLLESFDEDGANQPISNQVEAKDTTSPVIKTLLDDDSDINIPNSDIQLDLSLNTLPTEVAKSVSVPTSANEDKDLNSVINEFDVISSSETPLTQLPGINTQTPVKSIVESVDDDVDDEFAALAAESVSKSRRESFNPEFKDATDDPFNTSGVADTLENKINTSQFEVTQKDHTTFPTSPDVDIVLNPTEAWKPFDASVNNFSSTNLTGDETSTNQGLEPDPFDTSFAENILPGKAELKLIESEILGARELDINEARILSQSDSDSDFNPREEEHKFQVQSSVSIHITDTTGETQKSGDDLEITSLRPIHRDLLGGSTTDLSKLAHEPIEPKNIQEDNIAEEYIDPFDTSSVEVIVPGKAELKFIEKELLGEQENSLRRSISDPDFNPRETDNSAPQVDIVVEEVSEEQKFTKPDLININKTTNTHKVVAFDLPSPSGKPDLLAVGSDEEAHISKPLTPYYADIRPESLFEAVSENVLSDSDLDPFDTEFVEKLAPGKAELKLIESELVGETSDIKHSISDPDFNPRGEDIPTVPIFSHPSEGAPSNQFNRRFSDFTGDRKHTPPKTLQIRGITAATALPPIPAELTPARPDLLVSEENIPVTVKPLTPAVEVKGDQSLEYTEDFDPFDTSIANNLVPGKAELKVLENELIVEGSGLKRSYTDPDFNPRDLIPETAPTEFANEKPDLLNLPSEGEPITKLLTPLIEKEPEFIIGNGEDIDPFDTSIACDLAPGKAELRILESELIGQ